MGVHVPDRDRDPLGQPGPRGRLPGQRACPGPERGNGVGQLVVGETREIRVERREELPRWVMAVLPDALVPGGAGVAGLRPAQLPDDPVGGLDPALRPPVDLRVFLQQLQPLGELPLGGDLAAVAGDPRLGALVREGVDPVRLRLGRVMLPQLDVGVRAPGEPRQLAQRGPVRQRRQDGARGEVGADADDAGRVHPGGGDRGGHRRAQDIEVVLRVLQRPVRWQVLS